jgi:hypothetical protein
MASSLFTLLIVGALRQKPLGQPHTFSYAAPVFAWAFRQGNNPDAAPIVDPREARLFSQCMPLANFGRDYGLAFGLDGARLCSTHDVNVRRYAY